MTYNVLMAKQLILSCKRIQRTLFLMGGVCLLGACANIVPPCAGKNTPPAAELHGTHWELSRWNLPPNSMGEVRLRSLPNDQGQKIQVQFSGTRISGFGACNRFTGQLTEDSRGFSITQIATTRMACLSVREEIELEFLYLLNDYRTIARDGDRLLIIGPNREVLSFSQINPPSK